MGFVDMHSHILPAMDDGSVSMEQSVRMLRIAIEEGIDTIIATPHNMPGKGCPTAEKISHKAEELQAIADQYHLPIRISWGTEYYYREEVLQQLEEENGITLGNSDCVLVEFNPMEDKIYIRNAIRSIMGTIYRPVIAHVERYAQLMQDMDMVRALRKVGVLLQVNAASVIGEAGRRAKADTKKMLKEQLIDFVSTDAHSDGRRAPYIKKCAEYLYKRYPEDYVDALLFENARKLL